MRQIQLYEPGDHVIVDAGNGDAEEAYVATVRVNYGNPGLDVTYMVIVPTRKGTRIVGQDDVLSLV